jgi:hypothetical protein
MARTTNSMAVNESTVFSYRVAMGEVLSPLIRSTKRKLIRDRHHVEGKRTWQQDTSLIIVCSS